MDLSRPSTATKVNTGAAPLLFIFALFHWGEREGRPRGGARSRGGRGRRGPGPPPPPGGPRRRGRLCPPPRTSRQTSPRPRRERRATRRPFAGRGHGGPVPRSRTGLEVEAL